MSQYTLRWGEETLALNLPATWHVRGVLRPNEVPPVTSSLESPIGMARLLTHLSPDSIVTIVIDDISRPRPVKEIIPHGMDCLREAGDRAEDFTIVPALGFHRLMSLEEVRNRTGLKDLGEGRVKNPACDDLDQMAHLGEPSHGTPVYIAKAVAEADLVISIGCIEPHIIASFGGGYKNIIPGCAAHVTITHNHSLNAAPATFNMVGQPIKDNPMRQDLEEAVRLLESPVFLINTVLDADLNIVRVVAEDPIQAHRAGCEMSAQRFRMPVEGPADVVITNSFSMDSDLRQGVKALANKVRAVRRGGLMITLVRAEECVGVFGLAEKKLPFGHKALKLLAPY